MLPSPLALLRRSWHVALETPVAPAPCVLATWRWRRQQQWRVLHGRAMASVKLATYLWQGEQLWQESRSSFSVLSNSMEAQMGLATLQEYGKRQQLWRFRVFKYTTSFTIFFNCFPLQLLSFSWVWKFLWYQYFFVSYFVRWLWKFLWYHIFFVSYFVRLE